MTSTSCPRTIPETIASAADLNALAALRASMGDELAKEVLCTELARMDEACELLQTATRRGAWQEAAEHARAIAERATALGLRSVTNAAKSFAAATAEDVDAHVLRNGAQMVVFEHERLRLGIELQHPELLV